MEPRSLAARALLFDMDGTLIDSTSVITGLWKTWAARHGADIEAVLRASPGRRAIETVRLFAPQGIDVAAEATLLTRAAATEGLRAVQGASTLLGSLAPERWAIVTSAERDLAHRWLAHVGLPIPRVLVAAEDVGAGKPDPAGYRLAAERLGVPPSQAVVFEDAPAGVAAGKAAGAKVVALTTTLPPEELAAHHWIPDFLGVSFDPEGIGTLTFSPAFANQ